MSLVLVHGTRKPVIRIGRIAGQYAKPRSADNETRGDVTLPAYRGDIINRDAFTAADREPDPTLMLRAYERAGADAQLHPRADRRRVRRPAPPRVLGRLVREGHAERRAIREDRRARSASRSTSCRRSPASRTRCCAASTSSPATRRSRCRTSRRRPARCRAARAGTTCRRTFRGSGCAPRSSTARTSSSSAASATRSASRSARR